MTDDGGQPSVVDGRWSMVDGRWSMVDGRWSMVDSLAWWAVMAVAWLAPFQPVRPLVTGEYSDLRTAPALATLAIGLWLLSLVVGRRWPRLPRLLTVALALFLGLALFSAAFALVSRLEAFKFSGRLILGAGVCLAAADLAYTSARRWTLIVGLVISAVGVAGLGLAEFSALAPALNLLANFKVAPSQVGDLVRISSTFIYTTITSMYLELTIPLALGLLWVVWQRHPLWRVGVGFALVLLLEAMILTLTRSGLIATSGALVVMAGVAWRRGYHLQAGLAVGVGLALGVLVGGTMLLTPTLGLRLSTESDRAWYGVDYQWKPIPPLAAGEVVTATVTLTNTGRLAWQSTELRPYNLSYHWLAHNEDSVAEWEGARVRLPASVLPGQAVTVQIPVVAPPHSGPLRLAWDVVQDYVVWFSAKAVPMGIEYVDVLPRRVKPAVEPPPILLRPMPRDSAVDLSPSRRLLWGVALKMLLDRPLLGVGPDGFRLAYGHYAGQDVWDTSVHANNIYLEFLADMGFPGGLAFLGLVAATVLITLGSLGYGPLKAFIHSAPPRLTDRSVHYEPQRLWLATALAGSQAAWLIHGLFDTFYAFLPLALVYWVLLGLTASFTLWNE